VFTAFALEYRIRRIFKVLGLSHRERDTLGSLVTSFKTRVERATRLDNKKPIRLPSSWARLQLRLKRLVAARNRIVHGNEAEVQQVLTTRPRRVAARHFNTLVRFIETTNRAIGYDDPKRPERARYQQLRVHMK
jgi:hypothetical protein